MLFGKLWWSVRVSCLLWAYLVFSKHSITIFCHYWYHTTIRFYISQIFESVEHPMKCISILSTFSIMKLKFTISHTKTKQLKSGYLLLTNETSKVVQTNSTPMLSANVLSRKIFIGLLIGEKQSSCITRRKGTCLYHFQSGWYLQNRKTDCKRKPK